MASLHPQTPVKTLCPSATNSGGGAGASSADGDMIGPSGTSVDNGGGVGATGPFVDGGGAVGATGASVDVEAKVDCRLNFRSLGWQATTTKKREANIPRRGRLQYRGVALPSPSPRPNHFIGEFAPRNSKPPMFLTLSTLECWIKCCFTHAMKKGS